MRTRGTASRSAPPLPPRLLICWVCASTRVAIAEAASAPPLGSRLVFASASCGGGGACSAFTRSTFSVLFFSTSVSWRRRVNSIFTASVTSAISPRCEISACRKPKSAVEMATAPTSAIGNRNSEGCAAAKRAPLLAARRGRPEGDLLDPAGLHLVHHLAHDPGLRGLVGDHAPRVIGPLDVQALDQRPHLAQ